MLRLCTTLWLCQLRNYLGELGIQGIGIRILALTILVISMHDTTKGFHNNSIIYDIHIFLTGMSLYWILGEFVSGRYKRGIRLGSLFTSLSKIVPQNALEIFVLNKIDILIKQWLSLVFLIFVLTQDLSYVAGKGVHLFCVIALINLNDFFYSVVLTGCQLIYTKKKIYYINFSGFMVALIISICIIANNHWSFLDRDILLSLNIFSLFCVYGYNMFLCKQGQFLKKIKATVFRQEELNRLRTGNLNNLFMKIYAKIKSLTRNNVFAFCFAKELTQIYMEFVPFVGALLMGVFIIMLGLSPLFTLAEKPNACSAMYLLAVAYFSLVTSINFFVREDKTEWLLNMCHVHLNNYFFGKLIANYSVAFLAEILFYFLYRVVFLFWLNPSYIWNGIFYYGLLIATPLGLLWGIIWGYFDVPKIEYCYGEINYQYSENGLGIFFIFFSGTLIAEPLWKFIFSAYNSFYLGIAGFIAYETTLLLVARLRVKRKLFHII